MSVKRRMSVVSAECRSLSETWCVKKMREVEEGDSLRRDGEKSKAKKEDLTRQRSSAWALGPRCAHRIQ